MPLYDFLCLSGHKFEAQVPLKDFDLPVECACGSEAIRQISAPHFSVDTVDYTCPITGKWIGSKNQHLDNLSRHDCRVFETGEREAYDRNRKASEDAFDKSIDDTVEQTVESLDSSSRETLYSELTRQNLEATITRTTPGLVP